MISITHDPNLNITTIVLRGDKTIVFEYSSLPPQWKSKPAAYEQDIMDSVNAQIEQRKDFTAWYDDRDYKTDDPKYKTDPNQENVYKDSSTDEMIYASHTVIDVKWHEDRKEFLFSIRQNSGAVRS